MKKIKYIGYYDQDNKDENRNYFLSAVNKMTYICSTLNRAGYEVEVISASGTKNKQNCEGKQINISEHTTLRLFPSLGRGSKPKRIVKLILEQLHLFVYVLCHTKRNDLVIVYHSLGYARMIKWLKKIIHFKLILEVEEIYADVSSKESERNREWSLFHHADAFLFPTELLDAYINVNKKNSVVIYGTYQIEEDRASGMLFQDEQDKIHLLYAGTFDPRKGGAITAVNAAQALSSNYHIHILGFGSDEDKESLIKEIKKMNALQCATVTYVGLLSGEEYIRFVQNCHVGLSTQNPNASFNNTSFPSKVLSYMANGLRVVTVRIPVLEQSKLHELLFYYDENTPQSLAASVMKIDFSKSYNSKRVLLHLDDIFSSELSQLLQQLVH